MSLLLEALRRAEQQRLVTSAEGGSPPPAVTADRAAGENPAMRASPLSPTADSTAVAEMLAASAATFSSSAIWWRWLGAALVVGLALMGLLLVGYDMVQQRMGEETQRFLAGYLLQAPPLPHLVEERLRATPSAASDEQALPTVAVPTPSKKAPLPTAAVPTPSKKASLPTAAVPTPSKKASLPTAAVPTPSKKASLPTAAVPTPSKKASLPTAAASVPAKKVLPPARSARIVLPKPPLIAQQEWRSAVISERRGALQWQRQSSTAQQQRRQWRDSAEEAYRNKDYGAAERFYRRLLAVYPTDPTAMAALLRLPDNSPWQQREQRFLLALQQQPHAEMWFGLGLFYSDVKRWEAAQRAFSEALQRNPKHPDYLFNLAICRDQLGQASQAQALYRRALAARRHSQARFDADAARRRLQTLAP